MVLSYHLLSTQVSPHCHLDDVFHLHGAGVGPLNAVLAAV